jgi:hypothetical protein
MSAQTIGAITAELVRRGIPRWDKASHHPPICWWIYTDKDDEEVQCIHIAGRTEKDEEWQLEVICCLCHGHVGVVNVIDGDIAAVVASLQVWPGLTEAIEFALLALKLWKTELECRLAEEEEEAL